MAKMKFSFVISTFLRTSKNSIFAPVFVSLILMTNDFGIRLMLFSPLYFLLSFKSIITSPAFSAFSKKSKVLSPFSLFYHIGAQRNCLLRSLWAKIHIFAGDFFRAKIKILKLVKPSQDISSLFTKFHGVSSTDIGMP